jgi:DNA-binding transcriptional ArsR family regulator
MNMNSSGSARPAEVFWLETAEHFDILSDSTRLEIIELLARPHSVAELAEQMRGAANPALPPHQPPGRGRMIRVVDTRQAGAQTEKLYQVSAYSFQPSKEYLDKALPREKAQAVLASIFGTTEADFIRSVEEGTVTFEDQSASRRMHIRRGLLLLDEARLHEFIAELEEVYSKYDTATDDLDSIPDDAQVVATVSLVYPSARRIR